jgi:(2Fe-2S) ferredoxin
MSENIQSFQCNFCIKELHAGYDENDMVHCQGCHRIWDGYAQCPCWYEAVEEEDEEEVVEEENVEEENVEEEVVEEVVEEENVEEEAIGTVESVKIL